MSMRTLERAVLVGTQLVLNNRKIKMKDIMEWSTGNVSPQTGETVVYVSDPGVNVAVKTKHDKREGESNVSVQR